MISCAAAGAGGRAVGWESACIAFSGAGAADAAAAALALTLEELAKGSDGPGWGEAQASFHPLFDPWKNGNKGLRQIVLIPAGPGASQMLARRSQNHCPLADEAFRAVETAALRCIEIAGPAAELAWLDQTPHTLATARQDGELVLAAARRASARLEGLRIAEHAPAGHAGPKRPFSI